MSLEKIILCIPFQKLFLAYICPGQSIVLVKEVLESVRENLEFVETRV